MRWWILLALLSVVSAPALAQKSKHCKGEPVDSLVGPSHAYRECEVDQKAELRTTDVRVNFMPSIVSNGRCYRVEFEFVVDAQGMPELATVRRRSGNDKDLEDAVRASLGELQYTPARVGEIPVRQLVVYEKTAVVMRVISSSTGGSPVRPPSHPGC